MTAKCRSTSVQPGMRMMKPVFFHFGMLVGCLLAGLPLGHAADYYVRPPGTTATVASPYDSWTKAATNIQWAVDVAMTNLPATVWVTNGAYRVTNQITITNSITLKSMNGWSNTLVYADWPTYTTRVFSVANTGVLDGFAISNGHVFGYTNSSGTNHVFGGGAYIAASATVQNCYFTYNVCSNVGYGVGSGGGGIFASNATVRNCYFVTNTVYAGQGGGGGLFWGVAVIDNCDFIMNSTAMDLGYGGGLFIKDSGGRLWNSRIISNTAYAQGGGVLANNSACTFSNCTIAFNRAGTQGGGVNIGSSVHMTDCVISKNVGNPGGGVYAYNDQIFKNCQIVNNSSAGLGGGINLSYAGVLTNCVIAGNSGAGGGGLNSGGIVAVKLYSCRIYNNLNTASSGGGGLQLTGKNSFLRQCIIVNNTNLNGYGGGVNISSSGSGTVFESCTVAGNYSTNDGGGFYLAGTNQYVVNTIIHGNSSLLNNYPDIYNLIAENTGSFSNSCSSYAALPAGQGNITAAPLFVGGGNWQLSGGSPCINVGINQAWMTNALDLGGSQRIIYSLVDMGAYECIYSGTLYGFH